MTRETKAGLGHEPGSGDGLGDAETVQAVGPESFVVGVDRWDVAQRCPVIKRNGQPARSREVDVAF